MIDINMFFDYLYKHADIFISLSVFVFTIIFVKLFKIYLLERFKNLAQKTTFKWDDLIYEVLDRIGWYFYISLALLVASFFVVLPSKIEILIWLVFKISLIFVVVSILETISVFYIKIFLKSKRAFSTKRHKTVFGLIVTIVRIFLWVSAFIMVLQTLNYNPITLMGGLGMLGVVISIGLQGLTEQIFSFFSIYFDKPFVEGDFISIGEDSGTVEKIGIKTTRLKTVEGQELIVPNKELTSTRLKNFKKMKTRTKIFSIRVTYDTSFDKLKLISQIIKKIFKDIEDASFVSCFLSSLSEDSIVFDITYKINTGDYVRYRQIHEYVNYSILEQFQKYGIKFAYPTQKVFVKNIE